MSDRVGIFGLSLGSIMTIYLAAESRVFKVSSMQNILDLLFLELWICGCWTICQNQMEIQCLGGVIVFCFSLAVVFVSAATIFIYLERHSMKSMDCCTLGILLFCQQHKYSAWSFTVWPMWTITSDGRNAHKERLDENNHYIWRDMFLPITNNSATKVDVSTRQ